MGGQFVAPRTVCSGGRFVAGDGLYQGRFARGRFVGGRIVGAPCTYIGT